jgi:DNA-binding NarL/FixJ family response regulator
MRTMITDDHPVVREGFAAMIGTEPDMTVVAQARSGEEAIDLFRRVRPDVTLMDLRMPGMGGVDAIRAIRREFTASRLIVLTTYDGDEDIYRALEAGAQAYLLKDMICDEILAAIRAVHAGQRRIPAAVGTRLAERMTALGLSEREQRVLDLVATGKSNKEIAAALEITEATVKGHMTNVLGKLGVTDRTQAVITAIRRVLARGYAAVVLHERGSRRPIVSCRFARSHSASSSCRCNTDHSATRPIARGGSVPDKIVRLSIAIRASCSAYSAWKCGGTWSAKYILMTMP